MVITKHQNNKYSLKWRLVKDTIVSICRQVNSIESNELADVLSRSDYTLDQLKACACMKVTPNAYKRSPTEYAKAVQIGALVKKLGDVGLQGHESVRLQNTLNTFYERESENYFWNTHFFIVKDENQFINGVLKHARFFLRTIFNKEWNLPEFPDFTIGRGVTSSLRGADSNLYSKLNETSLVSKSLLQRMHLEKGNDVFYQSFFGLNAEIEDYCDVGVASKTAFVDRIVTFDGFVNKTIQRHYGEEIRSCLDATVYRKVPLRKRPEYHQSLMRGASLHQSKLCTIDVENASNSIYTSLVYDLLDRDMYRALNDSRIKKGIMPDGSIHEFEMFSANGNGFTFELETAIFYALAHGVKTMRNQPNAFISVFGDDIICSDTIFSDVVYTLENLGLKVNEEKTFGPTSYFKESCGADFFHGLHVRPKYFTKFGDGVLSIYRFHNAVKAVCENLDIDDSKICQNIINILPLDLRFFGPEALGDGVLHSENEHGVPYVTDVFKFNKKTYWCKKYKEFRTKYVRVKTGVHVHRWTKAVRQIVDVAETLQLDKLGYSYETIWKVMYMQTHGLSALHHVNPNHYDFPDTTAIVVDGDLVKLDHVPTILSTTGLRQMTGRSKVVYTVVS